MGFLEGNLSTEIATGVASIAAVTGGTSETLFDLILEAVKLTWILIISFPTLDP